MNESYLDNANYFLEEDYKINFKGDMSIEHAKAVFDKMVNDWASSDGIKNSIREFDSELSDEEIGMVVKDFNKEVLPKLLEILPKIK